MNKWREFAELHSMSTDDFENEVIVAAQAVLAMKLARIKKDKLTITNAQRDGVYQLTFERVFK
jgi:hypothetical protein